MTARINCPLCDWFHDDPGPNPKAVDPMALAGVFGPGVFAAHAIADHARKIEEILAAHFKKHTTVEWLRKVTDLQANSERYLWLRDGNAYAPEESGVTGGKDLDDLCDAALSVGKPKFTDGHGNDITHLVGEKR